jgi:hypothetical protein
MENGYKYLGILQHQENMQREVKSKVKREYEKRVRQFLKSKLNGANKIQALNAYAIPVVSYTGGIIDWTANEINELDRKTRKLLTIHKALHPKADVDRLYVSRKMGGRGLKKIKHVIEAEVIGLVDYIWNNNKDDPLIEAVKMSGLFQPPETDKETWKKTTKQELAHTWRQKPLHGQYVRQADEISTKQSTYKWLKEAGLKAETEALITAAQDQALNTKAHKTKIMNISNDSKCRLCKSMDETTEHILSGCQVLAGTEYTKRHNEVAKHIHRNLCENYGIQTPERAWMHQPEAVTETEEVKILWDFEIRTDRVIPARRPDIVVLNKSNRTVTIIDVAVPSDRNIKTKEREKIEKYQDLRLEIQRL